MVPTLSSMATEIATHFKKELDEPFKRVLAQSIDNWRSRLLRNSLQDKPADSKFFTQSIYIPMAQDTATPSCVAAPLCPVKKSTKNVPIPVRFSTQLFDYLGSVDAKNPFSEMIPGAGSFQLSGKYSRNVTYYRWEGMRIIVENQPNLPFVLGIAVFDRPSEVMQFNCDAGMDCDYWDKPYPCTGDVAQMIVKGILDEFTVPAASDKSIEVNAQNQEHAPDGK